MFIEHSITNNYTLLWAGNYVLNIVEGEAQRGESTSPRPHSCNKTPWHSHPTPPHTHTQNHRMQQLLCLIGLWSGLEVGRGINQCAWGLTGKAEEAEKISCPSASPSANFTKESTPFAVLEVFFFFHVLARAELFYAAAINL